MENVMTARRGAGVRGDTRTRAQALVIILGVFFGGNWHAAASEARSGRSGEQRFVEYALSQDGRELAEVVQDEVEGQSRASILLTHLNGASSTSLVIYRGAAISSLRWIGRRVIGFVDGASPRVIKEEDVKTRRVVGAVSARGDILDFTADQRAGKIAYTFRDWTQKNREWVSRKVTDRMGTLPLILPEWAIAYRTWGGSGEAATGFGVVRRNGVQRPHTGATYFDVHQLAWYGTPSRALLVRQTGARSMYSTSIVHLLDGSNVVDPKQLGWIYRIGGSPSGRLAIASSGPLTDRVPSHTAHLYIMTTDRRLHAVPCFTADAVSAIWWGTDHIIWVAAERSDSPGVAAEGELLAVDWQKNRIVREISWPKGTLRGCQMNRSRRIAVCLAETLTSSDRLVEINLETGRIVRLNGLWNEPEHLDVKFREIFVRNSFGRMSDGFLALPAREGAGVAGVPGKYPLAIILYGFSRSFARHGQWVQAYPVARLVHAGIAVLLLNIPTEFRWRRGDVARARVEMLESPLSTVLAAPAAVRASGVDIGRVMVLGWSWGGLLAAHAVEQSCEFVAAEVGDPAAWNDAEYSLYNAAVREQEEWLFGGPPDDRYMKNYLAFDPMHSGAAPHAPILFEYVSRNVPEGQYLAEWRAAGADVEAFAYHRSVHWLNVPAEAAVSRDRNLAWAKLNLLGPHSVPAKTLAKLGLTVPRPVRCSQ